MQVSLTTASTYILTLRRICAYLIDCILVFIGIVAAVQFLLWFITGGAFHRQIQSWWQLEGWITISVVVPTWLYFALSESGERRGTIGKQLLGLGVSTTAGERIKFGRALMRNVVKLVPWQLVHLGMFVPTATGFAAIGTPAVDTQPLLSYTCMSLAYLLIFVYLVALLFTGGKRSIHDMLSGTSVTPFRFLRTKR